MFQIIFSNLDNQFKVKRYFTIYTIPPHIKHKLYTPLMLNKCVEILGIRYYPYQSFILRQYVIYTPNSHCQYVIKDI